MYIYSKLQTELFRPIGPPQCSAETWERLTQMGTFMPTMVLQAWSARKQYAMTECSHHRVSELCSRARDETSPSRMLNKLRLRGSKRGIHLPEQVTVKLLHCPIALPWKHWYLTCPEERERNTQNCRQNCFGLLGLISAVQRLGKG